MAGEQNLPPSTFLKKHRHGEFREQPRRLIATRRWSRFYSTRVLNMTYFSHFWSEHTARKKPPKFGIRLIGKISNSHQQMRQSWVLRKTRNLTLPKTRGSVSAAHTTKWYISAPFSFVEGIKKPTFSAGFFYWRLLVFQGRFMNFSVFWIFVMGQLVLQGENHFFSFFGSFGTTTVGLLFIVVYLLNHLPGKSFLFLGVSPRFRLRCIHQGPSDTWESKRTQWCPFLGIG